MTDTATLVHESPAHPATTDRVTGGGAGGPTVVALVAEAPHVPSAAREAFAAACRSLDGEEAAVVLHTCHRVEVYAAAADLDPALLPAVPEGGRRLDDAAAARHLISVACGLQSAVIGEDQILHQTREAYARRLDDGHVHPVLARLFQVAMGAGRRAHDRLGGDKRSLGDAALDEIEARAGTIDGRPVLVVGAGGMGRLTAQAARRRGARVVVTSRTHQRAVRLAGQVGGQVAADGLLPPVVGVVVALSGPWTPHPVDAERVLDLGVTVVDLSSPAAVPAHLQERLGERFVSIDDLAWGPEHELPCRRARRARRDRLLVGSRVLSLARLARPPSPRSVPCRRPPTPDGPASSTGSTAGCHTSHPRIGPSSSR